MKSLKELAPESAAALEKDWPVYIDAVKNRLIAGASTYGDNSFHLPAENLIHEIQAELEDVCGWSWLLWCRLESVIAKLKENEHGDQSK